MQTHANPEDRAARRHRPKTLTVFAAAFTAGAALAYGVDRVVDVHVVQVEPQVESEPIFVALRSMPQGAPVTIWDVALKDWPKAMLPTTALKSNASFEGMVLRHPIREGQPLLSVQLVRDGALPTASIAALPPATPPAGDAVTQGTPAAVERFVPATPADEPLVAASEPRSDAAPQAGPRDTSVIAPGAAAVETPAPVEQSAETATAAGTLVAIEPPPADTTPVASSTDIDMAPTTERVPAALATDVVGLAGVDEAPADAAVVGSAGDAESAGLAAEAAAGGSSDADVTAAARVEPLPDTLVATPVAAAHEQPTPAAVGPMEPAATAGPAPTPLAAPVPALPSTDIEGALAGVGRTDAAETRVPPPQASVLDRTTEAVPPTAEPRMPRQHLVIPERIALAADASFTQPTLPETAPAAEAVPSTNQPATPVAAPGRTAVRKPTAMQPAARQTGRQQRQPAAKPQAPAKTQASAQSPSKTPAASKPQSPMARFWNAWVPNLSSGSRSR